MLRNWKSLHLITIVDTRNYTLFNTQEQLLSLSTLNVKTNVDTEYPDGDVLKFAINENMESFTFVPQLLINESELSEIRRMISAAKNRQCKIVGSLFGLWRNSLIQPVVQLITGPGQRGKMVERKFSPDYDYQEAIKKYLGEQHGLLQIGLWCSGDATRDLRRKCMKPARVNTL